MKKEKNVELSRYTTFKMGGTAKLFYTPETEEELLYLVKEKRPRFFLGGGSNLLINNRPYDMVVNLRLFNKSIKNFGNGIFEVGGSVRLQELISFINNENYGGIEYLYSVPGLVGGAVVMNAGRGERYKKAISDYIVSVKVLYDNKIEWIDKENCGFSYRNSIFKSEKYIVLAVKFSFDFVEKGKSDQLKRDRIELCKRLQDNSAPNIGTVFCEANNKIMHFIQKTPMRKCGNISYSSKTTNWMLNKDGLYKDAKRLIRRVEILHKILHKKFRVEVVMWD